MCLNNNKLKNNKNIKICIISTIKNSHVIRWSRALLAKGYDITVISSESNEWQISDIEIFECILSQSKMRSYNLLLQFIHSIKICLLLKKVKPDIVHIHSFDYIHPLMLAIVNFVTNELKNLIISVWGSDVIGDLHFKRSKRGRFSKMLLLRQTYKITATTHYLAKLTKKLTSQGKEIHIIPFGIDCEQFKKRNRTKKNQNIHIGYIKHLIPKYGPHYLLNAMSMVLQKYPSVRLIMVGHGKMEKDLKKIATTLNMKNSIQFKGYVQNEKIPAILENIDIFVMPSLMESFGVSSIEAQAMEVPVVASDVGGISEAVQNGITGILVEPKNVEQLANAIIKLIENPDDRERMGRAGRHFVVKNFNIVENVRAFERLYRKLAET